LFLFFVPGATFACRPLFFFSPPRSSRFLSFSVGQFGLPCLAQSFPPAVPYPLFSCFCRT
jgi:hypothetical protein